MKLVLDRSEEIAQNTYGFWFSSEEPVPFTPGQHADFTITAMEDPEENTHTFSFANAPDEDLFIATRMREASPFKRALKDLAGGDELELGAPGGRFVLPQDPDTSVVFLVGGIGITPVRSMIRHAQREGSTRPMTLFYANRTLEATAFHDEFERGPENLTYVPVLQEAPADWRYAAGRIDAQMIERHAPQLAASVVYVVGPPGMIAAMQELLGSMGIEKVRTESFSGYPGEN